MVWGLIFSGLIEAIIHLGRYLNGESFGLGDIIVPAFFLVSISIVWTGWRWAFLAPTVLILLLVLGGLAADGLSPFMKPATHWGDFEEWLVGLPVIGLFLCGAGAKLVQITRKEPLHLPAFTPYLISAIVGFALGGNLLAILNR